MNRRKIKKMIKRIEKRTQQLELWQQIVILFAVCGIFLMFLLSITQ